MTHASSILREAFPKVLFVGVILACGGTVADGPTGPSTQTLSGSYSLQSVDGNSLPIVGPSSQVTGGAVVPLGGDTVKVTHIVSSGATIAIQFAIYHGSVTGTQLVLSPIIADFVDSGTVGSATLVIRHHNSATTVETRTYSKN